MTTRLLQHLPNAISIARVFMAGGIAILLLVPHDHVIGVALIVSAIISDKLDGTLARLLDVESDIGKRIESVADPLFSMVAGVYLLLFFGLPLMHVLYASTLLIVGSLGRVLVWLETGNMFYQKSPITRYGVGIGYIIILSYALALPYRFEFFSIALVYGTVSFLNYWLMMSRQVHQHHA